MKKINNKKMLYVLLAILVIAAAAVIGISSFAGTKKKITVEFFTDKNLNGRYDRKKDAPCPGDSSAQLALYKGSTKVQTVSLSPLNCVVAFSPVAPGKYQIKIETSNFGNHLSSTTKTIKISGNRKIYWALTEATLYAPPPAPNF